ncbi:hypothetical protein VDGL01_00090 [Verticillium dahliae]
MHYAAKLPQTNHGLVSVELRDASLPRQHVGNPYTAALDRGSAKLDDDATPDTGGRPQDGVLLFHGEPLQTPRVLGRPVRLLLFSSFHRPEVARTEAGQTTKLGEEKFTQPLHLGPSQEEAPKDAVAVHGSAQRPARQRGRPLVEHDRVSDEQPRGARSMDLAAVAVAVAVVAAEPDLVAALPPREPPVFAPRRAALRHPVEEAQRGGRGEGEELRLLVDAVVKGLHGVRQQAEAGVRRDAGAQRLARDDGLGGGLEDFRVALRDDAQTRVGPHEDLEMDVVAADEPAAVGQQEHERALLAGRQGRRDELERILVRDRLEAGLAVGQQPRDDAALTGR